MQEGVSTECVDLHADWVIAKMDVWTLPLQTVQRDKLTIRTNGTSTRVEMGKNTVFHRLDAAVTRASTEFVRFVPYVRFVRYVPYGGELNKYE